MIKQVECVVYLVGTVCEDGGSIKDGAIWSGSSEEGGIYYIRHYVGQKVEETACSCGLRTAALTMRLEEKLQVAENSWVRRMCRAKRVDRRGVVGFRETEGYFEHTTMGRSHSEID